MIFSIFQLAIFAFVESGIGNAIIEAVAGSGKTTTIVEAMRRVKGTVLFLAFNKSISEELCKRGVNAKTFHGLCYSAVSQFLKVRNVDTNKTRNIIDRLMGDDAMIYGQFVMKLVGLGKQSGIGCLIEDTQQNWSDIASHHDLELESDKASYSVALDWASKVLNESNRVKAMDYDDMLYMVVKFGLTLPKFDFIFVDEAQDTNAIQRAILRKIMHATSRIVAVGDPSQAIYGFRGADSESLNMIAAEFNCIRLPLTVSYRCPTAVVEFAKTYVSNIESAPNAPKGNVESMGQKWAPNMFKADELVVCRTTAPLITLAYSMLKDHIPVKILGKDIGQGLQALIKKMNAKGIPALVDKLTEYTKREVEKATAKKQEQKAEAIQDKTDAILFLIDSLKETNRTIPALMSVIDNLFNDDTSTTMLATIHKAKGLEADKVYWLNSSKCPAQWAKQDWQKEQERNLCYVAITRAKSELVLIEERKELKQAA
jgi:DNA helicase II / ATP-dependent DNA helicase PcrA